MKITSEEAKKIAVQFIACQELKGFTYEFADINTRDKFPNEWNVIFDVKTPAGTLMDGPVIVIVNAITGDANFFS